MFRQIQVPARFDKDKEFSIYVIKFRESVRIVFVRSFFRSSAKPILRSTCSSFWSSYNFSFVLFSFPSVPLWISLAFLMRSSLRFKVLPVRSFSLSSLPLHVSGALNMRSPRENSVHFPKCSSMNSLFDSFCVNEWILCVCKFSFVGRPSHAAIRKFTLVQFQTAIKKLRGLVRIIPEPCAFNALDKSYADALRARLACTELLLNVYLTGGCDIYHSLSGLKIKCLIRGK